MNQYIKTYTEYRRRIKAFQYVDWIIGWDQETEAPKGSLEYRTKQVEVIAEESYRIQSDPLFIEAVEKLYENSKNLDDDLRIEIKYQHKELRFIKKIPKNEYIAFQVLCSKGSNIWAEAKEKDDFNLYLPILEEVVQTWRKFVKYLETPELKGYNILLDLYEEGFNVEIYDHFFNQLKAELVPFVLEVTSKNKIKFNKKLTKANFPKDQQEAFSRYLIEVFGYDLNHGVLKESAHPFTSGVSSADTRITTHYYENQIASSIFSTIHEMGHAIYEQQNDPKYDDTFLHGGASLGIHESQSRMYENMIGRSYAFWQLHYPKLVSFFPKQLKGISVVEFYQFINQAKRSLIRTEADELTYSLHIMVRYELEKALIDGKLKAKDLPKKWRQLMAEYVGKRPTTDREGVLQDIHWSFGAIGYFPTYALGSAYAAQIYQAMNKDFNVESAIENNNIHLINTWLKERIHTYAGSKTPHELLLNATGEAFDPQYYIDYLKRKFSQ